MAVANSNKPVIHQRQDDGREVLNGGFMPDRKTHEGTGKAPLGNLALRWPSSVV
jgi:hypothetical protein